MFRAPTIVVAMPSLVEGKTTSLSVCSLACCAPTLADRGIVKSGFVLLEQGIGRAEQLADYLPRKVGKGRSLRQLFLLSPEEVFQRLYPSSSHLARLLFTLLPFGND